MFFGNTTVGSVFSNLKIYPLPNDTTPPAIAGPGNLTREATSAAGAVVNFTATAMDAIDGPVNVVASPTSGTKFVIGTTPGGLAASDAGRNTAIDSFNVTVRDTTAPVVSVPGNITAEATSASGATVSYPAPTAAVQLCSEPAGNGGLFSLLACSSPRERREKTG